jgi:signal transduction histidine kinase
MPRLSLAPFRLRILFRGAFLALVLATLAMAVYVLQEEKQLSYTNYQDVFRKNAAQIAALLRHPTGQLALLNPPAADDDSGAVTPLHPLLLPYSSLDFDDQYKVQQAVEMAGCLVQYADYRSVCVAIGNNPWAGGFIYAAGSFVSTGLVAHARGQRDINQAHRLRVSVDLRGQHYQWIAPFESIGDANASALRGRLTGFVDDGHTELATRPVKDFRGWLWQSGRCLDGTAVSGCERRSFFSVRLPVAVLRDALFLGERPEWPPADLHRIHVHLEMLPPGDGPALLDSNSGNATPPFSLKDLAALLLPGEVLSIRKSGAESQELVRLVGSESHPEHVSHWIDRLIRRLKIEGENTPLEAHEVIATPLGSYEVALSSDARNVNRGLSAVASRVSWFVGAMLLAILLAWLAIEAGIISRITVLTQRAASVSKTVKATNSLADFNLNDLRGADELGILANCLSDLLRRVQEDVEREHIRAEQEKDLWHAVGHEIMSPLQSLMALHEGADNPSGRYIRRMQQAVRVLYGSASPSEAFQATTLQLSTIDLDRFLDNVATNAPCVGIAQVVFESAHTPVLVRADEYSLEDVVTHVLRNAERYRVPGTPITIRLEASETTATVRIHNQGTAIPDDLIDRIFEYGVSDRQDAGAQGNRGQGLFVAKTYMAKMGGTITAHNVTDGVSFLLSLPRVSDTP